MSALAADRPLCMRSILDCRFVDLAGWGFSRGHRCRTQIGLWGLRFNGGGYDGAQMARQRSRARLKWDGFNSGLSAKVRAMIQIVDTGVVFQNPLPGVQALQAQFPGLCLVSDQEIVCVYKRGPAPAAIECDYAVARSTDGGQTWHDEGVIWDRNRDDRPFSYGYGYPMRLSNGEILLTGYRWDRSVSDADFNIYNPETLGAVNCEALLFRSHDDGRTWSAPNTIAPPPPDSPSDDIAMVNPSGRIIALDGGRLLLPAESGKRWDDPEPVQQRSLALISRDRGETWDQSVTVAMDMQRRIIYWNGMFTRLDDGRISVMYWTKDTATEQDLTIHATYSQDEGQTWLPPYDTGLVGQMGCTIGVGDGRVMAIFNRRDEDKPGIWAAVGATNEGGDTWPQEGHTLIWDARSRNILGSDDQTNRSRSIYDEGLMAFGKPDVIRMADGSFLVAFWCTSNFVMHMRYARLIV